MQTQQPWILIGRTDAEAKVPIFWPPDVNSQLIGKDADAGRDCRQKEKRVIEDEMVGWHHWLNRHELGQTPGDGERQGSLACSSPSSLKKLDTGWWLSNNNKIQIQILRRHFCVSLKCKVNNGWRYKFVSQQSSDCV